MQLRWIFTVIGIWNNMVSVCIDQTGVLSRLSIPVDESNYGPSLSTQLTVSMGAFSLSEQYVLTHTHTHTGTHTNTHTKWHRVERGMSAPLVCSAYDCNW